MANNLPPPKIAIFERVIFGRQVAESRSASVLAVPVFARFDSARETARSTPAT